MARSRRRQAGKRSRRGAELRCARRLAWLQVGAAAVGVGAAVTIGGGSAWAAPTTDDPGGPSPAPATHAQSAPSEPAHPDPDRASGESESATKSTGESATTPSDAGDEGSPASDAQPATTESDAKRTEHTGGGSRASAQQDSDADPTASDRHGRQDKNADDASGGLTVTRMPSAVPDADAGQTASGSEPGAGPAASSAKSHLVVQAMAHRASAATDDSDPEPAAISAQSASSIRELVVADDFSTAHGSTSDPVASFLAAVEVFVAGLVRQVEYTFFNAAPTTKVSVEKEDLETGLIAGTIGATDADDAHLTYTVTTAPTGGKVQVADDGSFTYTPSATEAAAGGADSFTVKVDDEAGNAWHIHGLAELLGWYHPPTITVPLVITPVTVANPPVTVQPTGAPDPGTGATTYQLVSEDPDKTFTATVTGDPSHGDVATNPDGSFTYVPDHDYAHAVAAGGPNTDSFIVTATDSAGTSTPYTVNVVVAPQNVVPDVQESTGDADPDTGATSYTFDSTDADGDALTYTVVEQPTHGSFTEVDTTAAAVSFQAFAITALDVTTSTTKTYIYIPDLDYLHSVAAGASNQDTIRLQVDDGHGGTVPKTINATLSPVNSAPELTVQTSSPYTDGTVSVHASATDADHDALTYTFTTPSHGSVVQDPNNPQNFTYTPDYAYAHQISGPYFGTDSFTITVSDGHGGTDTKTANVNIRPLNAAPTISVVASQPDPTTGQVTITATASDTDGDTLTYGARSQNFGGTTFGRVTSDPASPNIFTYTPDTSGHTVLGIGSDYVVVTVADGHGGNANAQASFNLPPTVDHPPSVSASIGQPDPITGDTVVTITGGDVDGDTLQYTVSAASNGIVQADPAHANTYIYKPNWSYALQLAAGTTGADSFTVTADDGYGGSATIPVTVTIIPSSLKVDVSAPDPDSGLITVTATVIGAGADNPLLTYSNSASEHDGVITPVTTDPSAFTYAASHGFARQIAPGDSAPDSFTITATDGHGDVLTGTATVEVASQDHPPLLKTLVSEPDPITGAVTVTVFGADADWDTLSYQASTPANGGKVAVTDPTKPNIFTYTPEPAYAHQLGAGNVGSDTFTVTVDDGYGGTASLPVTVKVPFLNSAPAPSPYWAGPVYTWTPNPDPLTGQTNVDIDYVDTDGDPLTYTVFRGPSMGTLTNVTSGYSMSATYTPTALDRSIAGANTDDTIVVDVSDGYITVPVTVHLPVVPLIDNEVVGTLPGVGSADSIAISPDGSHIYTPGSGYGLTWVTDGAYSLSAGAIEIDDPAVPRYVAVSADGKTAFTANDDGTVSAIDTATNVVVATTPTSGFGHPSGITMGPDGNVYVPVDEWNETENTYSLDTSNGPVGVAFLGTEMAFGASGAGFAIYAPGGPQNSDPTVDPNVTNIVNTVALEYGGPGGAGDPNYGAYRDANGNLIFPGKGAISTGAGYPTAVVVSPDGKRAYVTTTAGDVKVIDANPASPTFLPQSDPFIADIPTGQNPVVVAVAPNSKRAYVVNYGSTTDDSDLGSVSVIDTDTTSYSYHKVIATIIGIPHPTDVAIGPDGTHAYVTAQDGVHVIDIVAEPAYTIDNIDHPTGDVSGSLRITNSTTDPFTFTLSTPPDARGTVTVDPATGAFTYAPRYTARLGALDAGSNDPDDTLDYFTIAGNNAEGASISIRVRVPIIEPVITTAESSTDPVTSAVTVTESFSNAVNDPPPYAATPLTYTVVGNPGKGTLQSLGNGQFVYTPSQAALAMVESANATAADKVDQFTYTVSDTNAEDGTVTARPITVTVPVTAPTIRVISGIMTQVRSVDSSDVKGGDLLAVSNDGTTLFVAATTPTGVSTVQMADLTPDAHTRDVVVGTGDAYTYTAQIIVDPTAGSHLLYVLNADSSGTSATLSTVDTAAGVVTRTMSLGADVAAMAISPDGGTMYVAKESDRDKSIYTDSVSIIDLGTQSVIANVPDVAGEDYAGVIAVSPNGGYAYFKDEGEVIYGGPADGVRILDTSTRQLTGYFIPQTVDSSGNYRGADSSWDPGEMVWQITFSPDGTKVYLYNPEGGGAGDDAGIETVDAATNTPTGGVILLPEAPLSVFPDRDMAVSPDGNFIYVTTTGMSDLLVISTQSRTVVDSIDLGADSVWPGQVVISPDGSHAYVERSQILDVPLPSADR